MLALLLAIAAAAIAQVRPLPPPRPLEIYWIDVEGGAATLIVSPSGESLLVDTGFPGTRDAQRISQAMVTAGISRIDHLVITHFHGDHIGGVPALAKLTSIRNFYDHGETVEPGLVANYIALAKDRRTIVKPGDKISLGNIELTFVSAAGKVLGDRLERGFFKTYCDDVVEKPADKTENGQSAGFLLTYGKFSFLDVGDLTWDREAQLACPVNKIGEVSLFQATHHGFSNGQSGNPALINSLRPQVVVVNNGARKGFSNPAYESIRSIRDLQDVWQLHRGEGNDAAHNTSDDLTANLSGAADQDKGLWIKARVRADGSFQIINGRNEFTKTYTAR